MARRRLRVALDANVLVAGVRLPRWPYEVLRAAMGGQFDVVLPRQVIDEARRHLDPARTAALEYFLGNCKHEEPPLPPADAVERQLDLVRSRKDVPIALALLVSEADIFVSNDRDFTEADATAERFRVRVRVMLPAVFLREVCGWSSEELEAVRSRGWEELGRG